MCTDNQIPFWNECNCNKFASALCENTDEHRPYCIEDKEALVLRNLN